MKYRIKEIFYTIQGEGSYAGTAVTFVRFAGCNRWSGREEHRAKSICSFCDTDFVGGEEMSATQIIAKIKALSLNAPCKEIVLSGGEPLLQVDMSLMRHLHSEHFNVHIETNGSIEIPDEMYNLTKNVCMSPKQSLDKTKLTQCDDLKILFPPIHEDITIKSFQNFSAKQKYIQPVWDANYKKNLESVINQVKERPDWKISLQTHKIMEIE